MTIGVHHILKTRLALFRFDDASVSPTSLQNALNTSAYVIFYEMVKTSRNQIVTSSPLKTKIDLSPKTPKVPEKKIIGPQLPPNSNGNVVKVAPSPRAISVGPNPNLVKLVKPKVNSEPLVTAEKPSLKPLASLVPYDGDSESEDEKVKRIDSPLSKPDTPANTTPTSKVSIKPTPSTATTNPSPFLPRAVNFNLKKLKETVKKEDSLALPNPVPPSVPKISSTNKPSPNRDSDAEAIFSSKNESSLVKSTAARNEFHVKDCESHSPSVHSDNSSGSTTSFTVTDIGESVRLTNSGESSFATSRQKWNVVSSASSEPAEPNKRSSFATESLEPAEKKSRKANLFDSGTGTILGKAAELGKDLMNAGAKLFKTGKPKDDGELSAMETSSVTSCEATTSHQNGKASSSIQDSEYGSKGGKKQKKKKKKHREDSDSEYWEEKTKENLSKFVKSSDEPSCKISTFNPDAPIKTWDSMPAPDSGPRTSGKSVTWDGRKSTNITDQLAKASEIR